MTEDELLKLAPGDMIKHRSYDWPIYIVTGNYGDRVTAVKTVDLTNSREWDVVHKIALRDRILKK